jgi:hypothetical protein
VPGLAYNYFALGFSVGIDRRLLLGLTVGSWWDRPSVLRSARTLNLTQQTEEKEDEQ